MYLSAETEIQYNLSFILVEVILFKMFHYMCEYIKFNDGLNTGFENQSEIIKLFLNTFTPFIIKRDGKICGPLFKIMVEVSNKFGYKYYYYFYQII